MARKLNWRLGEETLAEIVRLKGDGWSDAAIAESLGLARNTVKSARRRMGLMRDVADEPCEEPAQTERERATEALQIAAMILGRIGPMAVAELAALIRCDLAKLQIALGHGERWLFVKRMPDQRWRLTELGRREFLRVQRSA